MSTPCIAVSAEADFEAGTWTFEPTIPDFAVGAGRYAIIRETAFIALEQQRDELLAALGFILRGMDGGHITCAPYFDLDPDAEQLEFKHPADMLRAITKTKVTP